MLQHITNVNYDTGRIHISHRCLSSFVALH